MEPSEGYADPGRPEELGESDGGYPPPSWNFLAEMEDPDELGDLEGPGDLGEPEEPEGMEDAEDNIFVDASNC